MIKLNRKISKESSKHRYQTRMWGCSLQQISPTCVDRHTKMKMTKIITFSCAVTLNFHPWPWKDNHLTRSMTANVWAKFEDNPSNAFGSSHSNHYRLTIYISLILHDGAHNQTITVAKLQPNFALRNDTLYLILTDELWGILHELFPRKMTAIYGQWIV